MRAEDGDGALMVASGDLHDDRPLREPVVLDVDCFGSAFGELVGHLNHGIVDPVGCSDSTLAFEESRGERSQIP